MNHTSFVRRITKYTAGAIAMLLILIAVLTPTAVRTQAYVWPDRELVQGMSGEDVLSLQTRLAELGFEVGALDGYFGEYTEEALMAYQAYMGLYVDGVAGPITLTSLYGAWDGGTNDANGQFGANEGSGQNASNGSGQNNTNTSETAATGRNLVKGLTGSDVSVLQQLLENLGYATGGVDGIFGNLTEAAVIAFQQANDLYVDGIAGPMTMAALNSPAAVRSGSSGQINGQNASSQNANDQTTNNQASDNDGAAADNYSVSNITRELRKGVTGSDVMALQITLDALGFDTGGADGDFGNKTEAAVKAFQQAKGLYVDGIVGPITLAAMSGLGSVEPEPSANPQVTNDSDQNSSDTNNADKNSSDSNNAGITRELKKGLSGEDVKTLQNLLEALGYSVDGENGDFGSATEDAVADFQYRNGLYVDGVVGPLTLAVLTSDDAVAAPIIVETPPEVDPGFTGFAGNEYGDWYFIDGAVATNKTCLVKISYNGMSGWWYVKEGKVITFIDTPRLLNISMAKGGISISWEANEGVRKYRVYRMNSAGAWEYLADTANNYYLDTSVVSGNTYTYTVRAISPDGNTNLSDYNPYGLSLTYVYEYDNYVASVGGSVTKQMVEERAKRQGLDENEIIAILAWVEGEAYFKVNEPYLAYLSACVLINGIVDGVYARGEDVLNYIASWGSFYTVEKQKARYEKVSDGALLATYLALEYPVPNIYYCRGWSTKPRDCYYDSCYSVTGSIIYVW